MNREQLRDRLLGPVLQWTRLGRQVNALTTGSMEVVWQRSNALRRALPVPQGDTWAEVASMTREKVEVPIEAAGATLLAMQSEGQQFLAQTSAAAASMASGTLALVSCRSAEDFAVRQAALGDTMIEWALGWYQLWGRAAEVATQGLQPILRQVQDNAERLTQPAAKRR